MSERKHTQSSLAKEKVREGMEGRQKNGRCGALGLCFRGFLPTASDTSVRSTNHYLRAESQFYKISKFWGGQTKGWGQQLAVFHSSPTLCLFQCTMVCSVLHFAIEHWYHTL